MLIFLGRWPGWALLGAIPLLVCQGLIGLAFGVLAGTLNVFFRDVGKATDVILQFWFWLTPIVYPISIVPDGVRDWFVWNPMFHLVSGYQRIVLTQASPQWDSVVGVGVFAVLTGLIAWVTFRGLSGDLLDEL